MPRSVPAILGSLALAAAASSLACTPAAAGPAITFELFDTADYWRNLQGGLDVGNTTLNKLEAAITLDGQGMGLPGFHVYAQVFKANSESFSLARTGDIQVASNIEAPGFARLSEFWVDQSRGLDGQRGWAMARIGIIDLNRTFDSIEPAAFFINSSHGIGPELSQNGIIGPSIFPTTGPAAQAAWRPVKTVLLNVGVFAEPVPSGDFLFVDPQIRHGVLAIGQADWTPSKDRQVSIGLWRYSSPQPRVGDPTVSLAPRIGGYAFAEGGTPLPGGPSGWVRAGFADERVQPISAYVGAGLVWRGPGARRDLDQFGVAVAHAIIGHDARRDLDLPDAETSIEVSYAFAANGYVTLQPDFQFIVHPAGFPHLRDAAALGLRIVAGGKRTVGGD
jgi:porin